MFIWKPPAGLIIALNMLVIFLGGGFLLVNVLKVLPPGDTVAGILATATGIGIVISDTIYRGVRRLGPFNLEASTVFFILPTWLFSAVFFVAAYWWLR